MEFACMRIIFKFIALVFALIIFINNQAFAAAPAKNDNIFAAFIESAIGKSIIVAIFFAVIALFLRFLYGPKGIFREKHWDQLNSESKIAEAEKSQHKKNLQHIIALQEELEPLMQKEGRRFKEYVQTFHTNDSSLNELYRLKEEHSAGVFSNAWLLIQGESSLQKPEVSRALLLAALYHDIGRFEQVRAHYSFDDKKSLDHALLGAKILANKAFMPKENAGMRRLVRGAILLHSRGELPEALRKSGHSQLALVSRALRDADKLDIIRIMQEALRPGSPSDPSIYYNLPDTPEAYSPEALAAVLENRVLRTSYMHFCNDFRLRICGWAGFLEFATTSQQLLKNGHLENILGWLPQDENMDEVRKISRERLQDI